MNKKVTPYKESKLVQEVYHNWQDLQKIKSKIRYIEMLTSQIEGKIKTVAKELGLKLEKNGA